MTKKFLQNTLSKDAYWMTNKKIAQKVGLLGAILLADLLSKEEYFQNQNELDNMGGFFNTGENLKHDLNSGVKPIRKAKDNLIDSGFLKVKKRGVPAKNYFYIQHNNIVKFLSSEAETTELENPKRPNKEGQTGSTINKNKPIRINNKASKPKKVLRNDPIILDLIEYSSKYLKQELTLTEKDCKPLFGIVRTHSIEKIELAFKQAEKETFNYTFKSIIYSSSNIANLAAKQKPKEIKELIPHDTQAAMEKAFGKEKV